MPAPEPERPTSLLVLRHGESEWNASGRWQGHADPPLTELGRQQAAAAAPILAAECPPFDLVVASDLRRARETAEVLAGALGLGPVVIDPRLREADAGEWQGLTRAEIELRWPGWLDAGRRPPGFEPYDAAAARFGEALRDAAQAVPGGQALVISHGGVLRAARRQLGAPELRFAHVSGAWFTAHPGTDELRAGALVAPLEAREGSVVE